MEDNLHESHGAGAHESVVRISTTDSWVWSLAGNRLSTVGQHFLCLAQFRELLTIRILEVLVRRVIQFLRQTSVSHSAPYWRCSDHRAAYRVDTGLGVFPKSAKNAQPMARPPEEYCCCASCSSALPRPWCSKLSTATAILMTASLI